jgi:hypothetical protein
LINNAGALFARRRLTQDGLELTFALNHMAYFVLTEGLRKRLLASIPARIVNTASAAHQDATLDFDDLPIVARNCATSCLLGRSPAGCTARASPQIACIPVSSLHALATKAGARLRTGSGSQSFLRYLPLKVRKQSCTSRPRRTWPRPRGSTFTSASQPRRRRRHATTDLLCYCGSAARYWPA